MSIVARRPRQARAALGALVLGVFGRNGDCGPLHLGPNGFRPCPEIDADRRTTDDSFISQPDALSWIVGFLAGVAGILALTSAKSGAFVGLLISVTTVPAAPNVAVAVAHWVPSEAVGSSIQLLINLASIVLAGVLTLVVQRARQIGF